MKHSLKLDHITIKGEDGQVYIRLVGPDDNLIGDFTMGAYQADNFGKTLLEQAYAARDFKEPLRPAPHHVWLWELWKMLVRTGRFLRRLF